MTTGRILVVDDDTLNRAVLTRALVELGHVSATAENGREALSMLRAGPFDVVLLDVVMPELDGYQTLAQIKADSALRHIPVIMISAVDEMDSVIRCIEMGAEDYLPKPFNAGLLRARLNASLASKRLRDLELEYLEQLWRMAEAAAAVEANVFKVESLDQVAARPDALGRLARVFQKMAREAHAREQRLKRQLQQLQWDMDERQRAAKETVAVYLPMDRRQALAQGRTLPDRTRGTALFADFSGFTPLTESLARELGLQRGAEELTRQLNRVYGALIDEVHRYGGSVVNFSGDAITCWFDEKQEEERSGKEEGSETPFSFLLLSSLRATACALAMQEAMRQFVTIITPAGTTISLAIKVAVVAGPARRFLVGNPRIQEVEALAGRTLDELAAAEHLAQRGEVVVQATIVAELGQRLIVSDWRDEGRFAVVTGLAATEGRAAARPWPDLPPDAIPEAQAQSWLSPPVFEKVHGGKSELLSELRPAAALFLQFGGLDYEADDEAGVKLDAFVRWVQAVVDRRDGSLIQLTVGDKGSYLYVAFGVPVAHADDAARAVSAALELLPLPAELSFITGVQIGLAYGLMRAGAYGSPVQRAYGAIGDKTNLASRLMQAADSGILCDEAIHQAARAQFEFELLPPLTLKGKARPIVVYRPLRERTGAETTPLSQVGRAAERALLIDHLSPEDQLTLKAASVIGRVFPVDLLREVYPDETGRANLAEHLETLADLDLIALHSPAPALAYSFKDPLSHETAYNLMLFAQRRQLHRAVAEWHERTYAADLSPYYAVLAHHWRQADDVAKAIHYLEKAGEQAQRIGAYEAARKYFDESLALDAKGSVLSDDYYAGGDPDRRSPSAEE